MFKRWLYIIVAILMGFLMLGGKSGKALEPTGPSPGARIISEYNIRGIEANFKRTLYSDGLLVFSPSHFGGNVVDTSGIVTAPQNPYVLPRPKPDYRLFENKELVKRVEFYPGLKGGSNLSGLFKDFENLETIYFGDFDVSEVMDMSGMFDTAVRLEALDVGDWNTKNVKDMGAMFYQARSLTSLDVSKWDTSNVKDMTEMFNGAINLTTLDVSKWDTGNVRSMGSMFQDTMSLKELNVSMWKTENVRDMSFMFNGATILKELNVSMWKTGNVRNMSYMFNSAYSLKELDVSMWETGNVRDMSYMFNSAYSLKELDVSMWETENVSDMAYMFSTLTRLTNLDMSNWKIDNVKKMKGMFSDMINLRELIIPSTIPKSSDFLNMLPYRTSLSDYTGKWIKEDKTYGPYTPDEWNTEFRKNPEALAGKWIMEKRPTEYTLAFDGNQGVGSQPSITLEKDVKITVPVAKFYRFGYDFDGWSLNQNGSGTRYRAGDEVVNLATPGETATFYAQWKAVNNKYEIKDGKLTVEIKHGEALSFDQLPAGTGYKVYEETEDGWVLVESTNTNGSIKSKENQRAHFKNEKNSDKTSVVIEGLKQVNGKSEGAEGYEFELIKDGRVIERVQSGLGGKIQFSPLVFNAVGEYKYQVREVKGSNQGVEYDNHVEDVVVSVTKDKVLKAKIKTDRDGIVFNNKLKTVPLNIRKTLKGKTTSSEMFTFEVILTKQGGKVEKKEVKVKAGETVKVDDLQIGDSYSVKEVNVPKGYENVSVSQSEGIVTSNDTEIIVEAVNKYLIQGSINLQVQKELDGRDLKSGEFTFELINPDGEVIQTVTNTETGEINFDSLQLDEVGEWEYSIREVKGVDNSITYDESVKKVKIKAEDAGGGKLNVTATYVDGDNTFKNIYNEKTPPEEPTPEDKVGSFTLTKVVEGETELSKDAKFDVSVNLSSEGEYPFESTHQAKRYIKNGDIISIQSGEQWTVSNLPENTTVTLEELDHDNFKQLTDKSTLSGTIKADQNLDLTLINKYDPKGSWLPRASKVLLGGSVEDYQFTFYLIRDGELRQKVTSDRNGEIKFQDEVFTAEDLGKTYTYSLIEYDDGQPGITYDKKEYQIKVKVEEDSNGTLVGVPDVEHVVVTNAYDIPLPLTGSDKLKLTLALSTFLMLDAGLLYIWQKKKRLDNV